MDKAVKRYLAQLRRALTCAKEDRERLLSQGEKLLGEFLEENPNAHYEDLVTAFGQPKDFAAEMLSQLDPKEVERAGRQRKYIRRGLLVVVIVALILISAFWFSKWKVFHDIIGDNDWQVIEPAEQLTEEEYEEFWSHVGGENP